jgi:peptide/nickel transport system substrate-binding protein
MNTRKKLFLRMILLVVSLMTFFHLNAFAEEMVLKIGSPNMVSTANIVFDDYLPVFAHISNPPLTKMNADGAIVGQSAKSIEVSDDNTTWTFYLDENLYWSDGQKVTPEDVKFTIEFIANNVPWAGWLKDGLQEITIKEPNAVVVQFKKPFTQISRDLSSYNLLPKHIWEKIESPQDYTNNGENVGCGPFYIQKVDLNAGILTFAKNPYWKGQPPQLDRIEIHLYNNLDVLSLALEKGDVDTYYKYASSYPYPNIERLKKTDRFDFVEKLNVGLYFLALNLKRTPMSDLKFREAMASAINYEEIIKLDAIGYGKVPTRGFVPVSMEHFKTTEPLVYDVEKAKKILEEAGYTDSDQNGIREGQDGKDIQLTMLVEPDYVRRGELVKEYLEKVGIGVTIKNVDESTWIALKDQYQYDLTVTRTSPWGMMVYGSWATAYFDTRRTGEGVLHIVDDPAYLALVDGLLSTTDPATIQKLAYAVQDYYAENLPAIPLYWNMIVTPFNRRFSGWMPDPLFGIYNIDTFINLKKVTE